LTLDIVGFVTGRRVEGGGGGGGEADEGGVAEKVSGGVFLGVELQ